MKYPNAYIVIDIGTGNARVAVVQPDGRVLSVAHADIRYHKDELYPDALYFDPAALWSQITGLARQALAEVPGIKVKAITSTSQREGIVLIDHKGKPMIGLPNIDHRGREWENSIPRKNRIFQLSGRYPGSLFSAFKLAGIRERRKDIWKRLSVFLSISDWVEYQLTGIAKYEYSQASETLLFDVAKKEWNTELMGLFGIDGKLLPPLAASGAICGTITKKAATTLGLSATTAVVTGGGDTQLAIKSTRPYLDDMVIVSGTTTPLVKLVNTYVTDPQKRTWTSRDIEDKRFVLEANAGVTGLNYQRLKEIFYPNESYDTIEKELAANNSPCMASLGSLVAGEKKPLTKGGFVFSAPVTHTLSRSSFVRATLLDIAFSIAENYKILYEVAGHTPDYVWACGGGLQSPTLRQYIANSINKEVRVREGFEQSSATGGAFICNHALQVKSALPGKVETIVPGEQEEFVALYKEWKQTRACFQQTC
ncbi:MAG TPA: FGGY family carbohydrate kinase [Chitinophagaceae bacterium]|jgi:autoinducer 2 (AI-2) kinase